MRSKLFLACLVVLASFVLIPSMAVASPMADSGSVAVVEDLVDFGQLSPWMTVTEFSNDCPFQPCGTELDCLPGCGTNCYPTCAAGRCLYNC